MTDEVATKDDLRAAVSDLKAEMKAMENGLKVEMKVMENGLKVEMKAMERALLLEIGRAIGAYAERTESFIRTFDDKYAPLTPRVTAVEHTLEEHRGDYSLHKRPRQR